MVDPNVTCDNTDKEAPRKDFPKQVMVLPAVVNPRIDITEPKVAELKIEKLDPVWALPLNDNELPIQTSPKIEVGLDTIIEP
jgi:hypothetical protein